MIPMTNSVFVVYDRALGTDFLIEGVCLSVQRAFQKFLQIFARGKFQNVDHVIILTAAFEPAVKFRVQQLWKFVFQSKSLLL